MPLSAETFYRLGGSLHFDLCGGLDIDLDAKAATIRIIGGSEERRRAVIVALAEAMMGRTE